MEIEIFMEIDKTPPFRNIFFIPFDNLYNSDLLYIVFGFCRTVFFLKKAHTRTYSNKVHNTKQMLGVYYS